MTVLVSLLYLRVSLDLSSGLTTFKLFFPCYYWLFEFVIVVKPPFPMNLLLEEEDRLGLPPIVFSLSFLKTLESISLITSVGIYVT